MIEQSISAAISQLSQSRRGQVALKALADASPSLMGLDEYNQKAVINLLVAIWGPKRSTACDMIEGAVARGGYGQ